MVYEWAILGLTDALRALIASYADLQLSGHSAEMAILTRALSKRACVKQFRSSKDQIGQWCR
jgi:hypothetical protein